MPSCFLYHLTSHHHSSNHIFNIGNQVIDSNTFARSVNLMQQLPEDVFATCLVPEAEQLCQLNGALI